MKRNPETKKYCGNCGRHTAYNYPDQVFCGKRLSDSQDPVVQTLWHCENWSPDSQECNCVKDATKKQE